MQGFQEFLILESIYLSSRILRTMAHQRLIPERLAKVDTNGQPRLALLMTITDSAIIDPIAYCMYKVTVCIIKYTLGSLLYGP